MSAVGAEDTPQHSITLDAGSGPFVFGRAVPLKVSYRNRGKEPWVISNPEESLSTRVRFNHAGIQEHPMGYSLGRFTLTSAKTPLGDTLIAKVAPDPKPVSILPGQSYDFEVPFERGWTGIFVPGRWNVWIDDEGVKLKSNALEVPLTFTVESIRLCQQRAADEKVHLYERKSHFEWLQKIMPGLTMRWTQENPPEEERMKMENELKRKLHEFDLFLAGKGNEQTIKISIDGINLLANVWEDNK